MDKQYQVHVTFYGGGMVEAESMEEAIEIARERDWSAHGTAGIVIEDLKTGEERELSI